MRSEPRHVLPCHARDLTKSPGQPDQIAGRIPCRAFFFRRARTLHFSTVIRACLSAPNSEYRQGGGRHPSTCILKGLAFSPLRRASCGHSHHYTRRLYFTLYRSGDAGSIHYRSHCWRPQHYRLRPRGRCKSTSQHTTLPPPRARPTFLLL